MNLFKKFLGKGQQDAAEVQSETLYEYKLEFGVLKDWIDNLEDFETKVSRPIQDIFLDILGADSGDLYDISHEEDEDEPDLLGRFTFSFRSENQFRWEEELEDTQESLPLTSSNLMVAFTMKGGFIPQLALVLMQDEEEGECEVRFYNQELDKWYDVQMSKCLDSNSVPYGRFEGVF